MKGHMEKDGFHPHKAYKGVRKSRDQQEKIMGTKIRKARNQDLVYAESYNMGQNIKVVGHGNDWMLLIDRNVVGRATTQKEIFEMYDKVNVHPETGSPRFFDPRSPRSFKERKARDEIRTIRDLDGRDDFDLVQVDTDIEFFLDFLGQPKDEYGGLFIKQKDGDVVEAYGFQGIIPDLNKSVDRIETPNEVLEKKFGKRKKG